MAIYKRDRITIRELRFAYHASAPVRARYPLAEEILGRGRDTAERLYTAALDYLGELADDDPARAIRDAAGATLYASTLAVIRRFRAMIELQTTDGAGHLADADTARRAAALLETFAPEGAPSRLAPSGERLHTDAHTLRQGIASFAGMTELAATLDPALATFDQARRAVEREVAELDQAQRRLDLTREEAIRLRAAGRNLCLALIAWDPTLDLDIARIYPVRRAGPDDTALAELDDAGSPDVDDDPPGGEDGVSATPETATPAVTP